MLFASTVNFVFGSLGDKVPQSFIEDRTKLRGAPFDVKAMTAALPHHRDQFRAQAALVEAQLADGRHWLLGDFSLADASIYMNVWYVRSNLPDQADELLSAFPRLGEWESRVRALGHGMRRDISGQDALTIAIRTEPVSRGLCQIEADGPKPGDRVSVAADEPVKTAIEGEIVSLSVNHIAIRRQDSQAGEVVVHFPRLGYIVSKA